MLKVSLKYICSLQFILCFCLLKKESFEQRTFNERINQIEDDKEKLLMKIKGIENKICILNNEKKINCEIE